jgi:transposase
MDRIDAEEHSSGGKERLGKISKMGNPTLRSLLVVGATAVLQHARRGATTSPWPTALLARRPAKVAAIALANKMARIVWALLPKVGHSSESAELQNMRQPDTNMV